MAWPVEFQKSVVDALTEKVGVPRPCVVCDHTEWELADGFVTLSLGDDAKTVQLGGRIMPAVALVCRHCGHLELLNAIVLGVTPGEPPEPVPVGGEDEGAEVAES